MGYLYENFQVAECSVDYIDYDPQNPRVTMTLPNNANEIPIEAREIQYFLQRVSWPTITVPLTRENFFTGATTPTQQVAANVQGTIPGQMLQRDPHAGWFTANPLYQSPYGGDCKAIRFVHHTR